MVNVREVEGPVLIKLTEEETHLLNHVFDQVAAIKALLSSAEGSFESAWDYVYKAAGVEDRDKILRLRSDTGEIVEVTFAEG